MTQIIGLMSGTSKDGLDIAHVSFKHSDGGYSFKLLHGRTITYPKDILDALESIETLSASNIYQLDKQIGQFYGESVNDFLQQLAINSRDIVAIACHGQTIFHQPSKGFSTQIGCGSTLAFQTGINVINDFRTRDILAGGQGAPLVPLGDEYLFSNLAESFLNIGGFTNISFKKDGQLKAFDICPGNLPINRFANKYGKDFDSGGEISRSGELNTQLLATLNQIEYYNNSGPKSIGTEWLSSEFLSLINDFSVPSSIMRTIVEHEAIQIAEVLINEKLSSVYITGGGAKNNFLIERIAAHYSGKIIIPELELIDFKEAIIFAFLGYRYLENKATNDPNATGANRAIVSGVLHIPGY